MARRSRRMGDGQRGARQWRWCRKLEGCLSANLCALGVVAEGNRCRFLVGWCHFEQLAHRLAERVTD